jgi:signal transduction histidine kinase
MGVLGKLQPDPRQRGTSREPLRDSLPIRSGDPRGPADAPRTMSYSSFRGLPRRVRAWIDPVAEVPRGSATGSRVWSRGLQAAAEHPHAIDAALALVVAVAGLTGDGLTHRDVSVWILTFMLASPLVLRRRFPVATFVVVAWVAFAQWLLNLQLVADLALPIALFTVADERPRRPAIGAAAVLEVGAALATLKWSDAYDGLRTFLFLSGLVVAALIAGVYLRARRVYVASLLERADRLETERDQQAQLAAAAERSRIAREMHDVIAHSLAVIIALVDGARAKVGRDPAQADDALANVADLGRQTLDDTRRLLGVLRSSSGDEGLAPQPGITEIDDLVRQAAGTGLETRLRIDGEPFPVAPGPALSAFRIIQEAITNTLKHAVNARRVDVVLTYEGHVLEIEVTDDGAPTDEGVAVGRGGFGLGGMRERAALYDGSLVAGRNACGGWTVAARLVAIDRELR